MKNHNRIVVLTGSSLPNLNTLSTLINGDLNIVGSVIANQKKHGVNTKFLKSAIKKQGIITVTLQIVERIAYKLLNSKKDKKQLEKLFDRAHIMKSVDRFKEHTIETFSYDSPETIAWIKSKSPDLIIIHTPYWVSKKIRDIVNGNVIGGHPGITQYYRGIHSPFWAIYRNDFENIGYSIFWVDAGTDSGDLIFQGKITPEKEDSYITLSWKGMIAIADNIHKILNETESIEQIPKIMNTNVSKDTIYNHPTIINYLIYRMRCKLR